MARLCELSFMVVLLLSLQPLAQVAARNMPSHATESTAELAAGSPAGLDDNKNFVFGGVGGYAGVVGIPVVVGGGVGELGGVGGLGGLGGVGGGATGLGGVGGVGGGAGGGVGGGAGGTLP